MGPKAVTYYTVPLKFINSFTGLLANAFNVIFPYASELGSQSNKEKINQIFLRASKYFVAISTPGFLTLFIFSKPILIFWIGEGFTSKSWFVLSILSFTSVITSLTTIPIFITLGLGYSQLIVKFSIITVTLYLLFLPSITKLWGINGTCLGMLITTIPGILFIIYECKYVFFISIWTYVKEVIGIHLLPIFISFLLFIYLNFIFTFSSVYYLLIISIFFLFFYYLIMLKLNYLPSIESIYRKIIVN